MVAEAEWKVSMNCIGLEVLWQVYRLVDPDQCDHSGNREVIGTFDSPVAAQEFADFKNRRFLDSPNTTIGCGCNA